MVIIINRFWSELFHQDSKLYITKWQADFLIVFGKPVVHKWYWVKVLLNIRRIVSIQVVFFWKLRAAIAKNYNKLARSFKCSQNCGFWIILKTTLAVSCDDLFAPILESSSVFFSKIINWTEILSWTKRIAVAEWKVH